MSRYLILILAGALNACTSMSGYNASSSYACKAPSGAACDSISGVYANALHKRLPSQQSTASNTSTEYTPAIAPSDATSLPLRSATRILRLWVKPWEDSDGDLHDQSYIYVRIDEGQWQLDHVQHQVREAYAPLRPPLPTQSPADVEPLPPPAPLEALTRPFYPPLDSEAP